MSQAFFLPTRIFSGPRCVIEHSALLKTLGSRALVMSGKNSAKTSGAEADLVEALRKEGIPFVLFDEVQPNPGIQEVRAASEIAHREGVDFLIAVGGGSPIDAAKAAALMIRNGLDDEGFFANSFINPPLPLAAIPTTAGAGSEVTPYAMITDDRQQSKSNISHSDLFPRLAFLDARYTMGLPMQVTINTAVDSLSHALEGYLALRATPFSDALALSSLNILGKALPLLDPKRGIESIGPELRETLLRASTLSGMVIAHTGTTAAHGMGYSLTYSRHIDHGRANALTMTEYLEFLAEEFPDRVARAIGAMGLKDTKSLRSVLGGLLGPIESLSDEEVERFSAAAIKTRNMANTIRTPRKEDLAGIYRRSFPRP